MALTQASEAPAHLCHVLAVDQRIGPDNGARAGNTTLDMTCVTSFCIQKLLQVKSCVDTWTNRTMTNPQKQTNYSRLMTGSCNCPVGLPLPRAPKNTFPFVGLGFESQALSLNHCPAMLRLKKELPICRLCWAWACVALGWNVYITMHAS